MNKPRILLVNEGSILNTGFSTYGKEVMLRLHKTGKYELAEFASYVKTDDPRNKELPWKVYGNLPDTKEEEKVYQQNYKTNQFGEWRFTKVLMDFQADICLALRDHWMDEFITRHPLRNFYNIIYMPTVDGDPQQKQWIETFKGCDSIMTYSHWGKKVLERSGVKVVNVASPGTDLEVYKPLEKVERNALREKWGIRPDVPIFGTVMRNQPRKLYPDLIECYAKLRQKAKDLLKNPSVSAKEKKLAEQIELSILYLHTSVPDVGWDIPELIYDYGIQRHVLFTYVCQNPECEGKHGMACHYLGEDQGVCQICEKKTAITPNTRIGLDRKDLAEVYQLFDVYLQPSICEGWGMPITEAKSCGVPVMAPTWSAMWEQVENICGEGTTRHLGGVPIKVKALWREHATKQKRAQFDHDHLIELMCDYLSNKEKYVQLGKDARRCVEENFSYDMTVKFWEKVIDNAKLKPRSETWDSPIKIVTLPENIKCDKDLSEEAFVKWCYENILQQKVDAPGLRYWMKALKKNFKGDRQQLVATFGNIVNGRNKLEEMRAKKMGVILPEDKDEFTFEVVKEAGKLDKEDGMSIVIPIKEDLNQSKDLFDSLIKTADSNIPFEIIVIAHDIEDISHMEYLNSLPITLINYKGKFNFSRQINEGFKRAKGKYVVSMNHDIIPHNGWMTNMWDSLEANYQAVGCKLLYPNGKVQHAGIIFDNNLNPHHAFRNYNGDDFSVNMSREYQAVTAACAGYNKAALESIGWFDEDLGQSFNDILVCLKLKEQGGRILYRADCELTHKESVNVKKDKNWQTKYVNNFRTFLSKKPKIKPDVVVTAQ